MDVETASDRLLDFPEATQLEPSLRSLPHSKLSPSPPLVWFLSVSLYVRVPQIIQKIQTHFKSVLIMGPLSGCS